MQTLTIRKPDDFHAHLRQGNMLHNIVKYTAPSFARVLAMPNLKTPVLTGEHMKRYEKEINEELHKQSLQLDLVMTIKIIDSSTPEMIRYAHQVGAHTGKLYPVGMSVNSEDGVTDVRKLEHIFAVMQEIGMILCLHGENPKDGIVDGDREKEFLPDLKWLAQTFPKLKIIMEHCTSKDAIEVIRLLPDTVAATITVQHLFLTIDDVLRNDGLVIAPHNFCRPIAKTQEDREALIEAATSDSSKFFLGTDSAPHTRQAKEIDHAAGVFTAPIAIQLLIELFEKHGALDKLEAYVSEYGAKFYGLPLNKEKITFKKQSWTVPDEYDGVVPFKAGETLAWQIE